MYYQKEKKKEVNKFTSYVKWHSYSVRMKDVPPQIADILLANFGWFQFFNVEADFSKKKVALLFNNTVTCGKILWLSNTIKKKTKKKLTMTTSPPCLFSSPAIVEGYSRRNPRLCLCRSWKPVFCLYYYLRGFLYLDQIFFFFGSKIPLHP